MKHHWANLKQDVTKFIQNCETCQRKKLNRIRAKEQTIITDTPVNPNDEIVMDIFGPVIKTKQSNQFILSIQDQLTKYLILIPLKDLTASSIINELLNHHVYIFCAPKSILTDMEQNFARKLVDTFVKAFKIGHIKTTSIHPQSNRSLERIRTVVKELIRTYTTDRQNDWDENLKVIVWDIMLQYTKRPDIPHLN